jgi:hypothetical protein
MTYKLLSIFFPFPDLISIIMDYNSKTKEQLLKERLHIEMRYKKIIKDIKYICLLHNFFNKNITIKNKIKNINNDIEILKSYSINI